MQIFLSRAKASHLGSTVENTVSTSRNVNTHSSTKISPTVRASGTALHDIEIDPPTAKCSRPDPSTAPAHCAKTYKAHSMTDMLPTLIKAVVTAGLRCLKGWVLNENKNFLFKKKKKVVICLPLVSLLSLPSS